MLYKIKDKSMKPNFNEGDYVIVNPFAYIFKKPSKGDIVVVHHPNSDMLLLKRISSANNGSYFVVGDNKTKSKDSRNFGKIRRESIIGKVWLHFKP